MKTKKKIAYNSHFFFKIKFCVMALKLNLECVSHAAERLTIRYRDT